MTDYQQKAREAAIHAHNHAFSDHRGAMKWGEHVAVFGNDGYAADECSQLQVHVFRQLLDEKHVKELAFATDDRPCESPSDKSYTWAMIVGTDDVAAMHDAVWRAYQIASGCTPDDPWYQEFRRVQGGDAAD